MFRTFDMHAIRDVDGQVTGTFSAFYPENGARFSGRVTCFTIVDGKATWVGGIVDTFNISPSDVVTRLCGARSTMGHRRRWCTTSSASCCPA